MEPLRAGDPSRVGPYRLLRRLGAGGMGVVYLARTSSGSLVAVKVVRLAYARDTGFRARFRREVEAARRVTSPWVVPLLGADPEADSPWLASPYVSGPSLVEAVAGHGPLPAGSVRVLGARLAAALGAVHAAGLVHRDVKPGNVLLALDGPRLIDFGIARAPDDTALTVTGAIVGSPGFLSPEQAQGRNREIGPATDVFSLGCLLAFALTGHRPFGDGSAAVVLARTVYEEPDLDGVPAALAPLLRACLEKRAPTRPTVAEITRILDTTVETDWPPTRLSGLIARRSAQALALPGIEDTEAAAPGVPPDRADSSDARTADATTLGATSATGRAEPHGPTRRRLMLAVLPAGAAAAGVGGWAWWRASVRSSSGGGPRLAVALHADLTGPGRAMGRAQQRGALIAAEEVASRAEFGFRLDLGVHDDEGDAGRSGRLAERLVADKRILAVVGPTADDAAKAAANTYGAALLAMVTVSPGRLPTGAAAVRGVVVPTRPSDAALASALVAYLRAVASRKVALIDDVAEAEHSETVCHNVAEALNGSDTAVTWHTATRDADDELLRRIAGSVVDSGADAVLFPGGPERTARAAIALRSVGFTGTRLATGRAVSGAFTGRAGAAADGWVFAAPFLDPAGEDSAAAFVTAHRKRFDGAPAPYAAEAYDAVLLLATALAEVVPGNVERGSLVRQLRKTRYRGITKTLAYDAATHAWTDEGPYLFRASDGRFRYLGPYARLAGVRGRPTDTRA
ncbi:bifunctional serine/threonine-protein kinase/ABC transporter substrate-binding protein [Streptomyces sp. NPDC006863]|uniref:bifunctional serine/threonine-protein kinase/ABC transporter substrate-binding protein n=1 Tax=unclassified Streptomyces TaxID=2593676 RepID=UPI0033F39232